MKNFILLSMAFTMLSGCGTTKKAAQVPETSYWRKDSEKMFRIFGKTLATYDPEMATFIVSEKYEPFTAPYSKGYENFKYATAYRLKKKFEKYASEQKDRELRLDAKLIEDYLDIDIADVETNKEVGVVPFIPATKFILDKISTLIRSDAPQKRINNGMTKFRSYIRGTDKQMPFITGYTAYIVNRLELLEQKRMRGFWPTQSEIQDYIKTSEKNIAEIEKVLAIWKTDDWKRDVEALKEQDRDYRAFLAKKILPYSRKTHVLPSKVYANYLRAYGIKSNPAELIDVAKEDYRKTFKDFKKQAVATARAMKLSTTSPVDILNVLKSRRIRNPQELTQYHRDAISRITEIIKKNDILTYNEVPPLIVREANQGDGFVPTTFVMRNLPFSKKIITPQLIVASGDPGDNSFDYGHREYVVNFVARQVIPGSVLRYFYHDALNPTSTRTMFAATVHNAEGWAHYSEDLIYPFVNDEEKLVFLQRKLIRQARMYLDGEYHLGRITLEKVKDIYVHELGLSEKTVESEIRSIQKYPGALVSSYHGYLLLQKIKARIVKGKITEKCFNDYVVRAGVIPFDELSDRLSDNLFCGDS